MGKRKEKILSFALAFTMAFSQMPVTALAVTTETAPTGICEHHREHTDDCGYAEAVPGTDCTHVHTDECYKEVTDCVHSHNAECYAEMEDELLEDIATPSTATPSETVDLTECRHICGQDNGCMTLKLVCRHEHDGDCGYEAEVPEKSCKFVCEICSQQDSGEAEVEEEDAVQQVQDLIDGLPDVDAVTAEDYQRVQDAYAAYEALTDEQKAQITGVERFEELFGWFNGQIMMLAEVGEVYNLYVGGVQVTSANMNDVLGDEDKGATVKYNPDKNTLILDGAKITMQDGQSAINASGLDTPLIITLADGSQNTLTGGSDANGIITNGDLIINGTGTLNASGRVGIYSNGGITINGGSGTVSGGQAMNQIPEISDDIVVKGGYNESSLRWKNRYEIWVGDEQVLPDNKDDVLGDETVTYDPVNSILTLNGAVINVLSDQPAIKSNLFDLTVVLEGENILNGSGMTYGIQATDGDVTITSGEGADGTLTINGKTRYLYGIKGTNVIIKNADVTARCGGDTFANGIDGTNVEITNAKVTVESGAKNTNHAIYSTEKIAITDSEVNATGNNVTQGGNGTGSYGMYCASASAIITIENSKVTAMGGTIIENGSDFSAGIWSGGSIKINGDSTVTASSGKAGNSYGIYSCQDILIDGGRVAAESGEATSGMNNGSCGIYSEEGKIELSGGNITATGGSGTISYGIISMEDVIKINSSTVAAAGQNAKTSVGIYGQVGVIISGSSAVTAEGGVATYGMSAGIGSENITISDSSTVTATGGEAAADGNSYGIVGTYIAINGGSGVAKTIATEGTKGAMSSEPVFGTEIGSYGAYMDTSMSWGMKPVITTQPADQSVTVGRRAAFSVTVDGDELEYQWQSSTDGTVWEEMTGETEATLTITGTTTDMSGRKYRCVVKGFGDVTSESAVLTVTEKSSGDSDSGSSSQGSTDGKWHQNEHGWWYVNPDGSYEAGRLVKCDDGTEYEQISWKQIGGAWWAFGADGYAKTGWVLDEGTNLWYYIDENTGMKRGWYFDNRDGQWYYLDSVSGHMLTGWRLSDGKWYYFNPFSEGQTWFYDEATGMWNYDLARKNKPFGAMYQNTRTLDGYVVTEDGSWDGKAKNQ